MPAQKNWLLFPIAAVLVAFFCVPIGFLLYGGLASAIGGFILIGGLILLQWPFFLLMKKTGFIPDHTRPNEQEKPNLPSNP